MRRNFKAQPILRNALIGCGFLLTMFSANSYAGGIEANVTLASQYIWRGVNQSNNNPVVQGGFDKNFDNGLYGGVWASNVQTADPDNNLEADIYAGYAKEMGDFGLDVAYIRYEYPKAAFDFKELMFQASYKGLSVTYYDNLESALSDGQMEGYGRFRADINLSKAVGLTLAVGQSNLKNQSVINDGLIGLSGYAGDFKLAISGTTNSRSFPSGAKEDTDFLTVSVGKTF